MSSGFLSADDWDALVFRCDFQVHCPRGRQWRDAAPGNDDERAGYAAGLIVACLARGLDAIAIADHHDMAFMRFVRQAAAQETRAGCGGEG